MSDPQTTDAVIEGGKAVGSGGGLLALGWMLVQRFIKKEDENEKLVLGMLAEIKAGQVQTQASVATLSSDVRLLTDRGVRSDAEQAQMRIELSELKLKFAKFEGRLDQHLSGQIVE